MPELNEGELKLGATIGSECEPAFCVSASGSRALTVDAARRVTVPVPVCKH
jgi:hypothetical protein